jgi:hypothetical protein
MDSWLLKTDEYGDTIWTKTYKPESYGECFGKCIMETNDGYVYGGSSQEGFIVKTDFLGDTIWTKPNLHPLGGMTGTVSSVYLTYDGLYLIGRWWEFFPEDAGFVYLINENGDVLWSLILGMLTVEAAIQTSDSAYLFTGGDGDVLYLAKFASSVTGLEFSQDKISQSFSLSQNYPNPFNPITTIKFDLPKTCEASLKIFNILGEEVSTLVSDRLSAGSYSYEWDASSLASGVYLYRLKAGEYVETRKMVIMR